MRVLIRWGPLALVALVLGLTGCGSITGTDEIDELETQNAQLQATIVHLGTPASTIDALYALATQNFALQIAVGEQQGTTRALQQTVSGAGITNNASGFPPTATVPAAPPGDQALALPTPPPTSPLAVQQTTFTQTVTATGRDDLDCPTGITAVFEPAVDTIYVITHVNTLRAGSVISARWFANGQLFFDDVQCWVPEQDWENICAYCSIVPDAATFPTGSWDVELMLNNQRLTQARFQVVDSAGLTTPEAGMNDS
jgi:hypothetical protein